MKDFAQTFVTGLTANVVQCGFEGTINSSNPDYTIRNTYISAPQPGAGQKRGSIGQHTILVNTSLVNGNISFSATLDEDPSTATFVNVPIINILDGSSLDTIQLTYVIQATGPQPYCDKPQNALFYLLNGKYTWIIANITDFTLGTINSIKMRTY